VSAINRGSNPARYLKTTKRYSESVSFFVEATLNCGLCGFTVLFAMTAHNDYIHIVPITNSTMVLSGRYSVKKEFSGGELSGIIGNSIGCHTNQKQERNTGCTSFRMANRRSVYSLAFTNIFSAKGAVTFFLRSD
jgi:hypothetical protein